MGGRGRNFYSTRRPVSLGSGVANSFEEALANDQFRFKQGGETYLISARPTAIENEYALKVQSEAARGEQILKQSRSGNRALTSEVSTPADADLSLSAKKIGAINSGQKQFHHMMDLDSYAPFFQGRSDEDKAMMIGMLNKKGFYPGDDRRNYVGLGGNLWAKPGKGNFVSGIKGSEHQGKMHPLLSKNRREYPLPSPEEISQMSAVEAVETMLFNADVTIEGAPFKPTAVIKSMVPNKTSMEMSIAGMGTIAKQKFDGTSGYVEQQGMKQPMEEDEIAKAAGEKALFPELYYTAGDIELVSLSDLDGTDVYKIKVKGNKESFRYYDATSGLLLRREATEEAQGQTITSLEDFSEYKEVNGILIPFEQKIDLVFIFINFSKSRYHIENIL